MFGKCVCFGCGCRYQTLLHIGMDDFFAPMYCMCLHCFSYREKALSHQHRMTHNQMFDIILSISSNDDDFLQSIVKCVEIGYWRSRYLWHHEIWFDVADQCFYLGFWLPNIVSNLAKQAQVANWRAKMLWYSVSQQSVILTTHTNTIRQRQIDRAQNFCRNMHNPFAGPYIIHTFFSDVQLFRVLCDEKKMHMYDMNIS